MITLNFKKLHTDVYITEDNIEIPRELILGNKHEFNEPEHLTGWVQLPVGIISNGDIRLVGVTLAPRKNGEIGKTEEIGNLAPEFMRKPNIVGGIGGQLSNQEWIDQPEGFQLFKGEEKDQPMFPSDMKDIEDLTGKDEIFPEGEEHTTMPADLRHQNSQTLLPKELITTNKPWEPDENGCIWGAAAILDVLGIKARPNKNGSVHRWYHPAFGDDKPENHLLFDLETDSMSDIGFKLFRLGARLGTRALKLQIQNTIEQH